MADRESWVSPFDIEGGRPNKEGDFLREEVSLANRNSGILLEALRHDVTPAGHALPAQSFRRALRARRRPIGR